MDPIEKNKALFIAPYPTHLNSIRSLIFRKCS